MKSFMKTLMLSTALVTVTAFGAVAQQNAGSMAQGDDARSTVPAFLSSEFTGMDLYALDNDDARALNDGSGTNDMSSAERDRMRWTSSETFAAERDNWSDIGSISDIVMTKDGEFRGVLVDVGGFLGLGAKTVMIDFEELYFVTDDAQAEEVSDFYVVIAMSQDQLENLPEWNEEQLTAGFETRDYRTGGAASSGTDSDAAEKRDTAREGAGSAKDKAPIATGDTDTAVFSDDYEMLETDARTADRLIGADVYDANGENIGSVDDVVLDEQNEVSGILVDVGGFLGIGQHTVNLPIDDAQIGWNESEDDVRVMVSKSGEQLESMPEHDG